MWQAPLASHCLQRSVFSNRTEFFKKQHRRANCTEASRFMIRAWQSISVPDHAQCTTSSKVATASGRNLVAAGRLAALPWTVLIFPGLWGGANLVNVNTLRKRSILTSRRVSKGSRGAEREDPAISSSMRQGLICRKEARPFRFGEFCCGPRRFCRVRVPVAGNRRWPGMALSPFGDDLHEGTYSAHSARLPEIGSDGVNVRCTAHKDRTSMVGDFEFNFLVQRCQGAYTIMQEERVKDTLRGL